MDVQRAAVTAFMRRFAKTQSQPSFFQVLDVARRIAGTDSLGIQRYVILIEEKGSIGGHYLLDLKQSLGSCVAPHFKYLQPLWRVQAHRIGALQRRKQTMLQPVQFEGSAYVLCELQSTKDRVSLDRAQQNSKDLEMTIFEINGYQEVAALLSPNFQVHISALRPDKWLKAAALAFDLVVLIFAASWSSMRGRALVHGDRLKANKELTVLGVCNMVSSPFARRACRCGFFSPLGQCCCWRAKPLGRYCSSFYRCGRRACCCRHSMAASNKPSVKFVILSLEESSDLDNTAAKCLLALYKRLENNGQPLMLARVKGAVRDLLALLVPNELGRGKTMLWSAEDTVAFSISQQPFKTNLPWLTAM